MECNHKRIKKTYPFGEKSQSMKVCKDCGVVVTNKMLGIRKIKKQKNGRKKRKKIN